MPRQIERQLHAGREFGEALVNAELEIERAIQMPEHDRRGDRRIAGAQRHDFALTAFGECRGGAADKSGVACVLHQRGAALGLPAAGFQIKETLECGCDVVGRARHVEAYGAVLGEALTLAAQFLQFLGAQCIAEQFIGIARRFEAGADVTIQ